jgi:hypothetical protein
MSISHSGVYHKVLKIYSRDSISSLSNTADGRYAINNAGSMCTIQRIILKNASIMNVFYNIDTHNNYFFIYYSGTGRLYVTIPIGNYTTSSLLAYLNAHVAFTSTSTVLTFDTLTNKIITTSANNIVYEWYDGSGGLPINPTAFQLLGLLEGIDQNTTAGIPLIHPHLPDLSSLSNIYIEASFSKMNTIDSSGNNRNICGIVPIDVPFGEKIHYTNNESTLDSIERSVTYSQNLTDPEISLRDVTGRLLDMKGIHFELSFKVYMAYNI